MKFMARLSETETLSCGDPSPHEPHFWCLAAIDGDTYWCPGVNQPATHTGVTNEIRPDHYGGEENPFEPIKIIEHYDLNFNLGNVIKYVLREAFKGTPLSDLRKAYTYLGFEIQRRERAGETE
jgi:hypothetical protein